MTDCARAASPSRARKVTETILQRAVNLRSAKDYRANSTWWFTRAYCRGRRAIFMNTSSHIRFPTPSHPGCPDSWPNPLPEHCRQIPAKPSTDHVPRAAHVQARSTWFIEDHPERPKQPRCGDQEINTWRPEPCSPNNWYQSRPREPQKWQKGTMRL